MFFTGLEGVSALALLVACVWLARRSAAETFDREPPKTGLAWLLLAAGLAAPLLWGAGAWWLNALASARGLGLGLLVASVYLFLENVSAKRWLLGGLPLLVVGIAAPMLATCGCCESGAAGVVAGAQDASLLLELGPDDQIAEVEAVIGAYGGTYERAFPNVDLSEDEDLAQYFIVRCERQQLDALKAALAKDLENVDSVEENVRVEAVPTIAGTPAAKTAGEHTPNDPKVDQQWGFELTHAEAALSKLLSHNPSKIATVAIVDTGTDSKHEDLKGVFLSSRGDYDKDGHGTHCAGIAGASTNNGKGIASLNWEGRFIRIRGYDAIPGGWGTAEDVAQGIIDAAEDGADVISLSLGGYSPKPPKVEVDAIEYALSLGAIVVVAAGNSDDDAKFYAPANIPGVIVVGALDRDGSRASFSNTNDSLEQPIAAPGVDIMSATPKNGYAAWSGTSMATPMVSGLIGVMRSIDPSISAQEVYTILHETGATHQDHKKVGRTIDMNAAVEAVLAR